MKVIKESEFINEINEEDENVKIIKVNIDDSRFLANYYQIQSIPTLILLKNGQFLHRITGFSPKKTIQDLIEKGK